MTAPRVDERMARLLRGAGRYVADLVPDDALAMVVVRSEVAHGYLRGVDADEARQVPGVALVLHAGDLDVVPEVPVRVGTAPAFEARLQPALATDRVRYVGQPVAVVVATDRYVAEDAAELVDIDIEPLPAVTDPAAGGALWDAEGDAPFCRMTMTSGDELADDSDAVRVTASYRVERNAAMPLETRGSVVRFADDGELHVWGVTKVVQHVRAHLAAFLDLPPERVVCHPVDVGGMFGVRGELYPEDYLAVIAAQRTGRAVAWVEDRREHLLAVHHARDQCHRLSLRCAADGTLLDFDGEVRIDLGAYAGPIGTRLPEMTLDSMPGPYRWQGFRATCEGVPTNKPPVGVMRGPATMEATFVRERAIDVAARDLGLDPVAVRLRNLVPADAMPFRYELGAELPDLVYDSGDYPAMAGAFLDAAGYERRRDDAARRRDRGELAGVGVAMFVAHSGLAVEESVSLALDDDGEFRVGTSAAEFGQRLDAMAAEVAAGELGLRAEAVRVDVGSSYAHDGGRGSFSSRTTIFVGSAVRDAAIKVRDEAVRRAAALRGVPAAQVRVVDGHLDVAGERLEWKELAPIEVVGEHHMAHPTFGFGIQLAAVVVQPATGAVVVEHLAAGYDCGRVIDRPNAERQLLGATAQALSGALLEHVRYSDTANPVTTTFMDYRMASVLETPPIEVYLYELGPAPGNPLGVKGVGEAGMYGVGPAVANACADALQTRGPVLTELPLTAERVRAVLRGQR